MDQNLPQDPAATAPQGPGGPEAPAQGGGKLQAALSQAFSGLNSAEKMAAAAGDEAMASQLADLRAQFEAVVGGGGGEAPPPGPKGAGVTPIESGGAKVRPML